MIDRLGRELKDLRISVTDRCNFRCFFCMPPGKEVEFIDRKDLLTYEEIRRIVLLLIPKGLKKVRITGGEPLMRAHLENLIEMLSGLEGLRDIALTTNGYNLIEKAKALRDKGLTRITVSLPTLRRERLSKIVGRPVELERVIEGIEEALRVGFDVVKINAVVVRGVNDDEILDIAEFCRDRGLVLRFIEYMDVGTLNSWSMDMVVSAEEILSTLSKRYSLEEIGREGSETAIRYRYKDTGLEVGVIASVTKPFCRGCTRLRLSADGYLFTCLFSEKGFNVKRLLREGASDEEIGMRIEELWRAREDRYSEMRFSLSGKRQRVEMFRVGG